MSRKREADTEEDRNTRSAKALASTPMVQQAEANYNNMSEEEKRMQMERGFNRLPKDVQGIIASVNVGVLMNMAQLSKLFANLARQDWLWKRFFARDYPKEFAFCKGELPFYVLTQDHPFWTPGRVKPEDEPAWKRFYLHVANDYFEYVRGFVRTFHHEFEDSGVPTIDIDTATAKEIYNWCQKIPLGRHFAWYDWRTKFSWYFICAIVWNTLGPRVRFTNESLILATFWDIANIPGNEWLKPYLIHSHPGRKTMVHEGPSLREFRRFLEEMDEDTGPFDQFLEKNIPWTNQNLGLFTPQHEALLKALLKSYKDDPNFIQSIGLEKSEEYDSQIDVIMDIWNMLSYCFNNPCIFTLGMYMPSAKMVYASKELQKWFSDVRKPEESNRDLFMRLIFEETPEFVPGLEPLYVMKNGLDIFVFNYSGHNQIAQLFIKYLEPPRSKTHLRIDRQGKTTGRIRYVQKCISCGVISPNLSRCGGTCGDKSIIYCGTKCQIKHWKTEHSKICQGK